MSQRLLVGDLDEGLVIIPDSNCYFLVRRSVVKTGKNGASYMDMELSDGSKGVNGKVWSVTTELEESLSAGNVVKILNGRVNRYQSSLQIIVEDASVATPEEINRHPGILPESRCSEAELRERWEVLKGRLEPLHRAVLDAFEKSGEVWDLFTFIPAGKSMHHAYRRGLWEHSVTVSELALKVVEQYREMYRFNESLVLLGAMVHDIGKVFEFQVNCSSGIVERYSDRGRLLGHIFMGSTFMEKIVNSVEERDENFKMEFLHILLSHHGEYDFGSPKKPKTFESFIVATADNLDANLNAVQIGFSGEMDENWTKNIFSLQRPFYRGGSNE